VAPTDESEARWGAPAEGQAVERALPVGPLRRWLSAREAFERDWPVGVRNLWAVLHGKAPAAVVNAVWRAQRVLLCDARTPGGPRLARLALPGIVRHGGGELDKDLQRAVILCGESALPAEITDDDLLRTTDAALRTIQLGDLPTGTDPRLMRLVEQEIARRDAG